MAEEYRDTRQFKDATFARVDLSGARFTQVYLQGARIKETDLTGLRVVASQLEDVRLSGMHGRIGTVVVNDVDVTEFVNGELDRRYPERVGRRRARTVEDFRQLWATIEGGWAETFDRAERLPAAALDERVDDEWSFAETVRHLRFPVDTWIERLVMRGDRPLHRLNLPPTDHPDDQPGELGHGLDVPLTYAELRELFDDSGAEVRRALDQVTDDELNERRTVVLDPAWGEETFEVRDGLGTTCEEFIEHRRYAERDLARLESA